MLSSRELARQLTLVEHTLFSRISRTDYLADWSRPATGHAQPASGNGIRELVERMVLVVNWVATCVVRSADPVGSLVKWVDVVAECRALRNLHGVAEIVAGLQHEAVGETWNQLRAIASDGTAEGAEEAAEAASYLRYFDELRELCASSNNFEGLQVELRRCESPLCLSPEPLFNQRPDGCLRAVEPPCVPCLTPFLTKLRIAKTSPTGLDARFLERQDDVHSGRAIDLQRSRRIAPPLAQLLACQAVPYELRPLALSPVLATMAGDSIEVWSERELLKAFTDDTAGVFE